MSDLLFDRRCILTIDTLQITGLATKFKVKKDLKGKPNTAEISVSNLSRDYQDTIAQAKVVTVQLEAGYKDNTSVIFLGDLRSGYTKREGLDNVTTVSSGDGEKAHRTARVSVSHKRGATNADILRSLAGALGVGEGNLSSAISALTASGVGDLFTLGTVLSGSASTEMTRVCRSVGLTWSIQNGALQLLQISKATADSAILLDSTNGLIDSPSIDSKGVMKCKCLIQPDIFPGRLLVLVGKYLQGQFRIESTEHTGDTSTGAADWYVEITGKRY